MRIGIDQAAPAAAVERGPFAFGLREAVGDGVDHGRMMGHAAMAALDLDALDLGGGFFHATLPGADAVGTAEDRGGRDRRRLGQSATETLVYLIGAVAAGEFVDTP